MAAPKDGVGLSKISLPSGPGSLEGLGDSFEPQLNSGTAAHSVKIAAPPGVNGLQPEVVLRYNGGSGNGHFGLGWSDGLMCIQRQTEKGLPTYGPLDVFTFRARNWFPCRMAPTAPRRSPVSCASPALAKAGKSATSPARCIALA